MANGAARRRRASGLELNRRVVIFVHSTSDAGPAGARYPDDVPIDAAVQVATPEVLGRESVEVGQQAHGSEAYRSHRPVREISERRTDAASRRRRPSSPSA
jgi:hypothetical protein